ncbi:hypothetical protein Drorol1_Dr00026453 [Drosera rotundifolia]
MWRLVLIYQNLGNWSDVYYPLSGYTYLAPVLGLLALDGANISASDLPMLDIRASLQSISIHFLDVKTIPDKVVAKCVMFDLQGSINLCKVSSANTVRPLVRATLPWWSRPQPLYLPQYLLVNQSGTKNTESTSSRKHEKLFWEWWTEYYLWCFWAC